MAVNNDNYSKKEELLRKCEDWGIKVRGNESIETLELFLRLENNNSMH
jgi:hypothetical protein